MELTEAKRDDLKSLLEDHQKVTDALFNLPKRHFVVAITLNDEEYEDFTEVILPQSIARQTLKEAKAWVDNELKKLGVDIR